MSDHEYRPEQVEWDDSTEPVGGAEQPEGRPPEAGSAEPTGSDRPPKGRRIKRRVRRLTKEPVSKRAQFSGEQRLLILDVWRRSALPAADFAPLVGVSVHSLYKWKRV